MEGLQNHDTECAKVLSGELSQIRKMIKFRLSLEQIQLRLETVTDLGDVTWGATPSDVPS
jgi:division protein CdvB (Snf7/Vps24/ESCRT-III family)